MVEQLFKDPSSADVYIEGLGEKDIQDASSLIEPGSTIVVDGVSRGTTASTAYVTATTPEGGKITYEVDLVRNLIGWKVSDVDLYFASQHNDAASSGQQSQGSGSAGAASSEAASSGSAS